MDQPVGTTSQTELSGTTESAITRIQNRRAGTVEPCPVEEIDSTWPDEFDEWSEFGSWSEFNASVGLENPESS